MSPDRFSDEAIRRVLAFDPAAVIREAMAEAAGMPAEKRDRIRRGMERARLDAAEYLMHRGTRADRKLAARFILKLRPPGVAA